MSDLCHVCGQGKPVNPSVAFPVCGACKRALWGFTGRYEADALKQREQRALDNLEHAVVTLRRIKAARCGTASLLPFHPRPKASRAIPLKT
jgi:hypothetical protein